MFGTHPRSLDSKNRVVIPSQFRDELGDVFYITWGFHRVLEIRSTEEFKKFSEKFQSINSLDAEFRKLWRFISMNTVELSVDKLGRVTLPKNLLDLATIKKELSFTGLGNICELWAQEKLDGEVQQLSDPSEITQLVDALSKKGIVL